MKRWMVIAVVAIMLAGVGGAAALWNYRQNKPQKVWVPLALNASLTPEKREQVAAEIKAKLLEGPIILQVVKDVKLASKLGLPSDEAAEAVVRKQLFVEVGQADVPDGTKVPSVNIGVNCQRKTFAVMGEVATRMIKDVWKMLGIKDPATAPI